MRLPSSIHPSIHPSFIVLGKGRDWWIKQMAWLLPSCSPLPFPSSSPTILEALDVTVGLQWWEEDVEEPQADEQHGSQDLRSPGPTQLSTNLWPPSVHQCGNADKGKDGEERDREGQSAWIHSELFPLTVVIDGSNGPCHLPDISRNTNDCNNYWGSRCIYTIYGPFHSFIFKWAGLTPMPRKTLTALEPVTLPIDASAYWSWIAATLLANVSGDKDKQNKIKYKSEPA